MLALVISLTLGTVFRLETPAMSGPRPTGGPGPPVLAELENLVFRWVFCLKLVSNFAAV